MCRNARTPSPIIADSDLQGASARPQLEGSLQHPSAHKTSLLSKRSRKETTCIDGTEAVFASVRGACTNASNAIKPLPNMSCQGE